MAVEELRSFLGWCTLINYAVLLYWFAMLVLARDFIRRFHARWFSLPDEEFDFIHYGLMGIYKLGIILFNLAPYLALHIVG
jgi:hypothetical protein